LLYPAELLALVHTENMRHCSMERVMGIEPTYPAWKAGVLPLNYTRMGHSAKKYYHEIGRLSTGFFGKVMENFQRNAD
jgi:hypothetical protein